MFVLYLGAIISGTQVFIKIRVTCECAQTELVGLRRRRATSVGFYTVSGVGSELNWPKRMRHWAFPS